ncbi:hypothetical protein C1646_769059 [Rhizophagus diaphanus]|nr:hypothetical protein C1646_769059 [Rhizophagus diaphanus] [Rhizophagus sp. MUCL 43196]
MTSTYNPTEETINSILTGLLPVLIVGLFNGFEDSKRKTLSVINIFDDFVIFASIVVYPLITAIEWYQYYSTIVSGYLISTSPITTKIAFGICTLSFTRLVNHFNEKPDKINTLISIYLNTSEKKSKGKKKQIKILAEEIEKLTKEIREQAEQKEI